MVKENWAKYQWKSCDQELYLIFFLQCLICWWLFFFLNDRSVLVPQQERNGAVALQYTLMANSNSKYIYSNNKKKRKLVFWSVLLLLSCSFVMCVGDHWNPAFLYVMLDCTHTRIHMFSKSMCGSVSWQLNALSGFPRMPGPHRRPPQWRAGLAASVYVSAVPASNKDTACSFKYILNRKKGFYYSNGVYVCLIIYNWKHGAEGPPQPTTSSSERWSNVCFYYFFFLYWSEQVMVCCGAVALWSRGYAPVWACVDVEYIYAAHHSLAPLIIKGCYPTTAAAARRHRGKTRVSSGAAAAWVNMHCVYVSSD